jgi:hypothetical protein
MDLEERVSITRVLLLLLLLLLEFLIQTVNSMEVKNHSRKIESLNIVKQNNKLFKSKTEH